MKSLSFDVGHSSIGWAVLDQDKPLGCGTVTFKADDCQNHARASFRRMRRNIAARRNRIRRLEKFFLHTGVLSASDVQTTRIEPDKWPWLKAAKILGNHQSKPLTWPQLWGVLRWYAHNRGYDGNALWSGSNFASDDDEDTEKVQNARNLMDQYGCTTMAETLCAYLDVNPAIDERPVTNRYFKGQNAAFPRDVVKTEVRRILEFHDGRLDGCDKKLIESLCGDDHDAWKAISCPSIRLPKRYHGGLLFGQMVPRFHNRIIPTCRISGEKTPNKDCPAFYRYRWGMLMVNMRVNRPNGEHPELYASERHALHAVMEESGSLNVTSLKKALTLMGLEPANIDSLFMIPEFEKALVYNPVKVLLNSERVAQVWAAIPEKFQKIFVGRLVKGRPSSFALWRDDLAKELPDMAPIDEALKAAYAKYQKRLKKKAKPYDAFLATPLEPVRASGRAPYSTKLMNEAWNEVMDGKNPKASNGCLEETPEVIASQLRKAIDEKTNNHLVRHRLTIFRKLLEQLVDEFCDGDVSELDTVNIEVVRDLQEFSAKTQKQIKQLLGLKLAHHRKMAKYLEEELPKLGGNHKITAGLIKKVRIADELGWTCPFTGKKYCLADLIEGRVDREHIIPRSWRPSDSMSSLVLTFGEVNRFKAQRTAWEFMQAEETKKVPGAPHLQIQPLQRYKAFIGGLRPKSDPRNNPNATFIDDDRRRWQRKQLLLLPKYDARKRVNNDERFTEGSLTQSSYINKLAAQQVLDFSLDADGSADTLWDGPKIVHLSGSVTAATRKRWNLLGCLESICPQTANKVKSEVRDITHLHHALDAIVIGLTSWCFPNNGRLWTLMSRREIKDAKDQAEFRQLLYKSSASAQGYYLTEGAKVSFSKRGQWDISALPKELFSDIVACLSERRVVQHQPKTMRGLKVQLNTWRINGVDPDDDSKMQITQTKRGEGGIRHRIKDSQKRTKLLGLQPKQGKLRRDTKHGAKYNERTSKLKDLKGALVIAENYGVALIEPQPVVISYFDVWNRIEELKKKNNDEQPEIIQNGSLIEVPKQNGDKPYKYEGRWRVRSIKDTAQGIMLQLSAVDAVGSLTGNIILKTLLKKGLRVIKTDLTGKMKE